jgi:hypothetical protein
MGGCSVLKLDDQEMCSQFRDVRRFIFSFGLSYRTVRRIFLSDFDQRRRIVFETFQVKPGGQWT